MRTDKYFVRISYKPLRLPALAIRRIFEGPSALTDAVNFIRDFSTEHPVLDCCISACDVYAHCANH